MPDAGPKGKVTNSVAISPPIEAVERRRWALLRLPRDGGGGTMPGPAAAIDATAPAPMDAVERRRCREPSEEVVDSRRWVPFPFWVRLVREIGPGATPSCAGSPCCFLSNDTVAMSSRFCFFALPRREPAPCIRAWVDRRRCGTRVAAGNFLGDVAAVGRLAKAGTEPLRVASLRGWTWAPIATTEARRCFLRAPDIGNFTAGIEDRRDRRASSVASRPSSRPAASRRL